MLTAEDFKSIVEEAWKKTLDFYKSRRVKLGKEEDLRCLFYHYCFEGLQKIGSFEILTEVSSTSVGGELDLVIGDNIAVEMKYWRPGKKLEAALAEYHNDLKRLCKVAPDYKYGYFLAIDETGGELDSHCGQKVIQGATVMTNIYSLSEEEAIETAEAVPDKYRNTEFEKPYRVLSKASLDLGISDGMYCNKNRPSGKPANILWYIFDDKDAVEKYGIEWIEVDWLSQPGKALVFAAWYRKDLPEGFKTELTGTGFDKWYRDYWAENKPHKLSKTSMTHVLIDELTMDQLTPSRVTERIKKLSGVIASKGFKIKPSS